MAEVYVARLIESNPISPPQCPLWDRGHFRQLGNLITRVLVFRAIWVTNMRLITTNFQILGISFR